MADQALQTQAQVRETLPFPSKRWFQRLADLMNENRALHEKLGYVDCVAAFTVTDGGPGGDALSYQVTFEEFAAVDVREVRAPEERARADFAVEATLATWREMIESIAAGNGRPDLEHTLNRLTHTGEPMRMVAGDPLKGDLYFRYNQSLQEFFNASAAFDTEFSAKD